jgi:hypothetical protein
VRRGKSLKKLKTLEEMKMDEVLVYFAVKYKGNFQKILTALQNKERVSNEESNRKYQL